MRQTLRQTVIYGMVAGTGLLVLLDQLGIDPSRLAVPFLAITLCFTWMTNLWGGFGMASLKWLLALRAIDWAGKWNPRGQLPREFIEPTLEFLITLLLCLACDRIRRLMKLERKLARRDGISGLLNRKGFQEQLQSEISRSQRFERPLTLIYFDCDQFKELNDSRGHRVGDKLLSAVGKVILAQTREFDAAGRLGGDEFAILLTEANQSAAEQVVNRLREKLKADVESRFPPVTFSIGVVTFMPPIPSREVCLELADRAMYAVKHHGKNNVHYELRDGIPAVTLSGSSTEIPRG